MLEKIIEFSIKNKLIVILFTLTIAVFGLISIFRISIGAVPDITNNQVQIITTSPNLSTQEIEQFITAPVEMEMANLPGVVEIRSVSKFGISLVTIVFEERMGTYLPRQLIAEKLKTAAANIPEGFGQPEMGPITTGLGEIYQYTISIKPGYENRYTATDLRTIQDWYIKRRLSGINGVVEINSWGGYLKQYEVAIDPSRLAAMNITLLEVYDALTKNNSIAGGAYIEKTNQSYFIRGDGQIKNIKDIENIIIKNVNGIPILIKDIADVKIGYANRYGAITANGKGETVLGQVMMLKNANSQKVIKEVKKRIEEIQKTLPEGIYIDPIVDRSELVAKTTTTVVENLILGAIIVMLTVFLLLGNIRAAWVITSVIPLALLFTISMMYVFGMEVNLISLGALDFGVIIDGAVIIVEFITLKILENKEKLTLLNEEDYKELMNTISLDGASKMMKSAIFGQIIILIVFIPILSLTGVEGKMFRPMAMAFCFAIIGAMILGLTWVPVAASLFLKPPKIERKTFADTIVALAQKSYLPVIKWACFHKRIVLGLAIFILAVTLFIFSKMGGEFVPTLDEGDFVIQPVFKTGTSLSKTIELVSQIEKTLIDSFPEVEKIVSRIGAAEVPTDPMSMEEVDIIVKLKPKKYWTSAKTKDELADRFAQALSVIPGVEYEFTQPIEMRFNELITGVRSDIAIKIFGEDLDYINAKALEIKELIKDVPGAAEIILEKTVGLPQIKIDYNRHKIAYYDLDIQTVNDYVTAAFGGKSAGVVFEQEKRFDLVVRFDKKFRKDIEDIEKLRIPLPNGTQIPISEVANIYYTEGPAKISRENAQRRVVVGINVRNRDLQSVVNDINKIIDKNVKLREGTYITYGGQFENLKNAKRRLMIAVPIALALIFIFLHFAFKEIKDAIMIFIAIPLAAVGGVLALWIRGLPFSVSAGVGFIALFGIAVLNGIVLIEHFKELLHNNPNMPIRDLIIQGTTRRLRPVMMTAGAAAMGFLPMAISTSAGAEVQRPLATVVIGGLITSTLLTMVVLPLLFEIFYNVVGIKLFPLRFIRKNQTFIIVILLLLSTNFAFSQNKVLTIAEAIDLTLKNNQELKAYETKTFSQKALISSAISIPKTTFTYGYDQNNIAQNNFPLKVWGINQSFSFPTVYSSEFQAKKTQYEISKTEFTFQKNTVIKNVCNNFIQLQILNQKLKIYKILDSIYKDLVKIFALKNLKGDINTMEYLSITAKHQQIKNQTAELQYKANHTYLLLKKMIGIDSAFTTSDEITILQINDPVVDTTPYDNYFKQQLLLKSNYISIEKNKILPEFYVNYFVGTNFYENARYYHGFEIGVSIPIFYKHYKSNITAAQLDYKATEMSLNYQLQIIKLQRKELFNYYKVLKEQIENLTPINLFDEIVRTSTISYQLGEIDFYKFSTNIETALNIKLNYLDLIQQYNSIVLEINYP